MKRILTAAIVAALTLTSSAAARGVPSTPPAPVPDGVVTIKQAANATRGLAPQVVGFACTGTRCKVVNCKGVGRYVNASVRCTIRWSDVDGRVFRRYVLTVDDGRGRWSGWVRA